jgi:hypothetical protein
MKNLLTEAEVAVLKQSIAEELGIKMNLDEAKATEFWRTIRGQKMQFKGIPDDNKPDTLLKGGSKHIRMAIAGQKDALKKITDKVKNAKAKIKGAKNKLSSKLNRLGKAGKEAKKLAMDVIDQIAVLAGDTV